MITQIGKIKIQVLFSLLAIAVLSQGQTNADSLNALLSRAPNDSIYVEILNELSILYYQTDPLIALDYAVKAEKIAQNCSYTEGQALAYSNIADLSSKKGNYELAIEYYTNSLNLYQRLNNKKGIAHTYNHLGLILTNQKQYEKALDIHNKALVINKELHDSVGIVKCYENIGVNYSEQGKYDKALIQFYNSLRLKETLNDKSGMANILENIGTIYYLIETYDQAQVNFERSLSLYEQIQNNTGIAKSLIYLGDIYNFQNSKIKAQDALVRSLEINKKLNNLEGMADAYLKIGNIKASIGKQNQAYDNFIYSLYYYDQIQNFKGIVLSRLALAKYYFKLGDFENAQIQIIKALPLTQNKNYLTEEYELLKLLADIYLKQENFVKTSSTLLRANLLADSLCNKKIDKEIKQLQFLNEFEKKMQQKELEALKLNSLHQLKLQKTKTIGEIAILVLLLLIILTITIFKKRIETKKQNKILALQKKQIDIQVATLIDQKKELENANQTKDKFLAIIGNDLRNPFNTINSFISKITEQPQKIDEATLMKYLYLIKDAGADAMNLLENLMDWAKTQTNEIVPQKENVPLNYILRGNILFIKEMAQQKNIEIIEEIVENPIVHIDKNMINAVIRNLLSNALKFTNNGGTIWVKTIINNDELKVLIQDTGIGISDDVLCNLFEPGVIKRGLDGMVSSGLGLILCKEFLHYHRQELRVDSKINFGTTFWFYLPIAE